MTYIRSTSINPFGLTLKQQLFVAYIVRSIHKGEPVNPTQTIKKVYDVKTHNTAKSMASENLTKPNIREALNYELERSGILGKNGKVTEVLKAGLNASIAVGQSSPKHFVPDHKTRLLYIQEVLKICGVY